MSSSALPTVTFKAPSLLIMLLTSMFDASFCLGNDGKISTSESYQAGEEQAIRDANTPQIMWEKEQPNVVISRS